MDIAVLCVLTLVIVVLCGALGFVTWQWSKAQAKASAEFWHHFDQTLMRALIVNDKHYEIAERELEARNPNVGRRRSSPAPMSEPDEQPIGQEALAQFANT